MNGMTDSAMVVLAVQTAVQTALSHGGQSVQAASSILVTIAGMVVASVWTFLMHHFGIKTGNKMATDQASTTITRSGYSQTSFQSVKTPVVMDAPVAPEAKADLKPTITMTTN